MLDPEGMIYQEFSKHDFCGAARDVVICNCLLWSLYIFPQMDPLKTWSKSAK